MSAELCGHAARAFSCEELAVWPHLSKKTFPVTDVSFLKVSGNYDAEACRGTVACLQGQFTAVGANNFARQAEAKPRAIHALAPGLIHAEESLKDSFVVCWWYLRAGIHNAHNYMIHLSHQLEANQAVGMIVFDCIAGEILQRLFQQVGIGVDLEVGRNLVFHSQLRGLSVAILDDIGEHGAQIYRLELEAKPSGIRQR